MSKRHSILIVADHASNFIPDEYNNLGLSQKLLDTHIAYDIGVKQLALELSKKLKAHLVMGDYSRLLIDLNRGIMDPTLIPSISHGVKIVQNYKLSSRDKKYRINEIYSKYNDTIYKIIKRKKINIIISLHSFNPSYKKKKRNIKLISKISKEKRYKTYSKVKRYSYNKQEVKEGRKMGHLNFTKI